MPFTSVACKAGYFQGQDRTHIALAHGTQQPLEPRARRSRAGTSLIVVDDHHVRPTELLGVHLQRVLASAALLVVTDLVG